MALQKFIDSMDTKGIPNDTRMKYKEILHTMTPENWLSFCEEESELVFSWCNSQGADGLDNNDGWYRVYKVILEKHPQYIDEIIPVWRLLHENPKTRLTEQQYNDLREMPMCRKYLDSKKLDQAFRQNNHELVLHEFMTLLKSRQ